MRKALIISLLCLLSCAGFAKDLRFMSDKLRQIAQAEGIVIPDYQGNPTESIIYRQNGRQYPVIVEYSPDGVMHIGLNVFGTEIKNEDPVIYRFVERYMLEQMALFTPSEAKRNMSSDGVSIAGDINSVFAMDAGSIRVNCTTTSDFSGSVSIASAGGTSLFSISYPLNISLLTGMDKAELDAFFITGLRSAKAVTRQTVPTNLSRIGKDLYVSENGYYETPAVQNSSFFQRRQNRYDPVCESRLPKESVMTLLTAYVGSKHYTARLKQSAYNYSTVEVDVPLSQLLTYCLESGCTPYVGIEECDRKCIRASLFMVNEALGYCHTFKVDMHPSLLDHEDGSMDISVHAFTPIHNLHR